MPAEYQVHGRTQYSWASPSALNNLRLDTDVPKPKDIPSGHVLLRIRAAALNARDNMVIAHDPIYPGPHMQDLVPCADGAGEIEAVGEDSKWKVGSRVVIAVNPWMDWQYNGAEELPSVAEAKARGGSDFQGTLREYAVLPDEHVMLAPDHLSFEELAALPAACGTAMHALLYGPRPLRPGQTVLAQGTGGVSCMVIQLASAIGATVIATSSSDDKLKHAKALGATYTVNYTEHRNWEDEVLRLTSGKGVDVVVEVAGASTIEQSLKSTKHGGLVALVGFLSESKSSDLVAQIIFGGKTVYGVFNFTKSMVEHALRIVAEKKIHPAVAKVFDWEDAKGAFEMLGKQNAVGKIVVRVGAK